MPVEAAGKYDALKASSENETKRKWIFTLGQLKILQIAIDSAYIEIENSG